MLMAALLGSKPTYANYVLGFYATTALVVAAMVLSLVMKPPKTADKVTQS